jgi:hypothetical protein
MEIWNPIRSKPVPASQLAVSATMAEVNVPPYLGVSAEGLDVVVGATEVGAAVAGAVVARGALVVSAVPHEVRSSTRVRREAVIRHTLLFINPTPYLMTL